jgi:hypothetical protein
VRSLFLLSCGVTIGPARAYLARNI